MEEKPLLLPLGARDGEIPGKLYPRAPLFSELNLQGVMDLGEFLPPSPLLLAVPPLVTLSLLFIFVVILTGALVTLSLLLPWWQELVVPWVSLPHGPHPFCSLKLQGVEGPEEF